METFITSANRGSISTGYNIDNSLKLEPDNSENLKWTNISSYATSARKKTFSFSVWFKITELGVQRTIWATSTNGYLLLQADGQLKWQQSYGGVVKTLNTTRLFRDTSAWYHVIIAVDSTQSTEANRTRLYVNGVEETDLTSTTYPSQNAEGENVYADHHYLGAYGGSQIYWGGYMSDVYFISDAQITPSDVGEFDEDSNIWKPIAYTGTISSPSYFLEFKDSSDLGTATSGLDADTLSNIAAADQATDTPTNNFAIANPLLTVGGFMKPTEGGTKGVLSTSGPGNNTGGTSLVSTIPVSKGKWYFEAQNTNSGDVYLYLGVGDTGSINLWGIDGVKLTNQTSSSVGWRGGGANDGKVYGRSAGTNYTSTNPVTWETEVVGLALDLDNEKIYFHKSGTWINSGDPANGTDNGGQYDLVTGVEDQWLIAVSAYNLATWHVNFGGYTTMTISSAATDANGYGTFEYAPPSGYYALCTKNLAEYG